MDTITASGRPFTVRRARLDDVAAIMALMADDPLGTTREPADPAQYEAAFHDIDADPNHFLAVVTQGDVVVGTLQLTIIPGMSRGGTKRLQIEGVRVAAHARRLGLGVALMEWAHEFGVRHGARLAQLSSDRQRPDAHRFYERLGYVPSHVGFKRSLVPIPEVRSTS